MSRVFRVNISYGRIMIFVLILLYGFAGKAFSVSMDLSDGNDINTHFAYLDTGTVIDEKMMSLAAGSRVTYLDVDTKIKAIHTADSLPDGFEPSDSNTISEESSPFPIYIFFDNTDHSGIMYVYTEGDRIVAGQSLGWAFNNMSGLADISGLSDWDVSQAIDMRCTFYGTTSLKDISALENWDTSNVIIFGGTFYYSGITNASPLSKWDTSSAVSMMYMFANAKSLRFADVSGWDTSKVESMKSMFAVGDNYQGNGKLRGILGLGNLDVSKVTDMTCMFYGAGNMTHYDIAGWDVSNVRSFNHMFCDNFRLEELDLSRWDVSNVQTIFDMFDDNYMLRTIGDVSHWNTASLIDAGGWLNGASSFVGNNGTLDLSGWDTRNLKATGEMFRGIKTEAIDLSGWTFESITNDRWPGAGDGIYYESGNTSGYKGMAGMFLNASRLQNVYISREGYDLLQEKPAEEDDPIDMTDMWKGTLTEDFSISGENPKGNGE